MLAAALAFAVTMITTKQLTRTDSTFAIIFWMNAIQLPLAFAGSDPLFVGQARRGADSGGVAIGLAGLASHYCLSNAFRAGDAGLVVPLDFMRIPLIAVVGWWFYGESLDVFVFVGAGLIIAGILWNLRAEAMRPRGAERTGAEPAPYRSGCGRRSDAGRMFTLWSPFQRFIADRELRAGLRRMTETVMANPVRRLGAGLLLLAGLAAPAAAQMGFPSASAQSPGPRNQACVRLRKPARRDRSRHASIRRAPIRSSATRRPIARQQGELDRLGQQAHRMGCQGSGFFALFSGQPAQCGQLNNQIQQARANLDRLLMELQHVQGNSADREGQRRSILAALGQNDCGPQYRQYATAAPGGLFESLFGIRTPLGPPDAPLSGTYRTVCVRTCDGFYFPISYSTVPSRFAEDESLCQRLCPATEVALYSHRNPGEDVTQAVSSSGRSYSELPNALSYRKQFNAACSCRAPGQSWADALRPLDDRTIERGDIVVTEEQARLLSQPRTDAQGRPIRLDPTPARAAPAPKTPAAPKSTAASPAAPVAAASAPEGRGRPQQAQGAHDRTDLLSGALTALLCPQDARKNYAAGCHRR